jgi:hypothetical protein
MAVITAELTKLGPTGVMPSADEPMYIEAYQAVAGECAPLGVDLPTD